MWGQEGHRPRMASAAALPRARAMQELCIYQVTQDLMNQMAECISSTFFYRHVFYFDFSIYAHSVQLVDVQVLHVCFINSSRV